MKPLTILFQGVPIFATQEGWYVGVWGFFPVSESPTLGEVKRFIESKYGPR